MLARYRKLRTCRVYTRNMAVQSGGADVYCIETRICACVDQSHVPMTWRWKGDVVSSARYIRIYLRTIARTLLGKNSELQI